jgi:putative ABC transport system substrate-binding protein
VKKTLFLLICVSFTLTCKSEKSDNQIVVGIAKIASHPALDAVERGIMEVMAKRKVDVHFNLQNANGDAKQASQIARQFQAEQVSLAVGIATPTAKALVNHLEDIPVVFTAVTNPLSSGISETLEGSGTNVTGYSDLTPVQDQLELLLRVGDFKRIGMIYNSSEDNSRYLLEVTRESCDLLGLELVDVSVNNINEVRQAAEAVSAQVDVIYVSTDNMVISGLNSITEVAEKAGIPVLSADPSSAETAGVALAYGFNYYQMGVATGGLIMRIIRGDDPGAIPVQYLTDPSDLQLVINLDVMKQLGLSVPESLVESAALLIENGELKQQS